MSLTRLASRVDPDIPIDRLWLVFFCEAEGAPWWSRCLAPGFRHVIAAAWFDDQQRWVLVDPTRRGTVVLLYRQDQFGGRFQQLMDSSSVVLRVVARRSRSATPFGWWCTGAVKALLGVRACALSPRQLCRHLLRHGAEVVKMPAPARSIHGKPVQT